MANSLYIVTDRAEVVMCVHEQPVRGLSSRIKIAREVSLKTASVTLSWQLQLNGDLRKLGRCQVCGQVYATDQIL